MIARRKATPILTAALAAVLSAPARAALPPVVDPAAMDRGVDACTDFYEYACGTWRRNNPVPPDQSKWYRSSELDEHTRDVLRTILSSDTQKIGAYYASCMDEAAIETKGLAPLQTELARIAALTDKSALPAEIARLHALGAGALFGFSSSQDYTDASRIIAAADQGGFALPDRDYYLLDNFKEDRKNYIEHLEKMFGLLGDDPKRAQAAAATVLKIETALAKAAMSRVDRREPKNVHHKMTSAAFSALAPSFAWKDYLASVGAPAFAELDAVDPAFFSGLDAALKSFSLDEWKTYLRWTLLHASAPMLPAAFVAEDFDFFGRKVGGQEQIKARWKRCVEYADAGLGEALGRAYVEREFGPRAKARVLEMVRAIEKVMDADINALPWMTAKTKILAIQKLRSVANKIGYPDKWRDYSKLDVVKGDALGNLQRADAFELRRQLAKIGGPVDRGEWFMTPPTDNAYYDPQMNDINFPAGILQPPNFDVTADAAANYGAIGAVIGHELTHAFDDEGRHYDRRGNLADWWSEDDAKAFEARAQGFVDEYSAFVTVKDPQDRAKDIKLNGRLTLGENIADNGGLLLAYRALLQDPDGAKEQNLDGFTVPQRFFVSYAQSWCLNQTPESTRKAATVDPHSTGQYRVNGVVSNMREFREAFSCKEGSPMTPARLNGVW